MSQRHLCTPSRNAAITYVIDEPLYAHYLYTKYGAQALESTHPATAEVMASMSTDGATSHRTGNPRSLREASAVHETDGAPSHQHRPKFPPTHLQRLAHPRPARDAPISRKSHRDTDTRRHGIQDPTRSLNRPTRCGSISPDFLMRDCY